MPDLIWSTLYQFYTDQLVYWSVLYWSVLNLFYTGPSYTSYVLVSFTLVLQRSALYWSV